MIVLIDYGMGNLRSVMNAFEALGHKAITTRDPKDLAEATGIVLPGVGAFGQGMSNLKTSGFIDALQEQVSHRKKPFLGICLGMQLLAELGTEHGSHAGLGFVTGRVDRFELSEEWRIPHIGWNDVHFNKTERLFRNLGEAQTFYFVHSYCLHPGDQTTIAGMCNYGTDFVAAIEADNLSAVQFHPEKSHKAGLAVLDNWRKSF